MLKKLTALFWPVTKAKLHRLVTWVGVAFAALTVVLSWWGTLGLSTEGKLAATVGILTTLAAGWRKAAPKIEAGIEALPIPADDVVTAAETPAAKAGECPVCNGDRYVEPGGLLMACPRCANPTGGQAAAKGAGK